jgi:hypothetical protein
MSRVNIDGADASAWTGKSFTSLRPLRDCQAIRSAGGRAVGFLRHPVRREPSVRSPEVGSMVIASTVFSIATLAITIRIL